MISKEESFIDEPRDRTSSVTAWRRFIETFRLVNMGESMRQDSYAALGDSFKSLFERYPDNVCFDKNNLSIIIFPFKWVGPGLGESDIDDYGYGQIKRSNEGYEFNFTAKPYEARNRLRRQHTEIELNGNGRATIMTWIETADTLNQFSQQGSTILEEPYNRNLPPALARDISSAIALEYFTPAPDNEVALIIAKKSV
jgi:hypothetical protein